MTTPEEQTRAIEKTQAFLLTLQHLNFRKAGTTKWVRDEAFHLLRHYPITRRIDADFAAECIAFASNPKRGCKPF
jgi:hypothetical protein